MATTSLLDLPLELINEILSYCIGPFSGRKGSTGHNWIMDGHIMHTHDHMSIRQSRKTFPLFRLALTCGRMHDIVENYASTTCKKVFPAKSEELLAAGVNGVARGESRPIKRRKVHSAYRVVWWKLAFKHCVFCGKGSQRRAMFNNNVRCCLRCDGKTWPPRMTMTEAKTRYALNKEQLGIFLDDVSSDEVLARRAAGELPPRIPHAEFTNCGLWTTMLFQADVEMVAEWVHGDLERFMENKQAQREKRAQSKMQHERQLIASRQSS